jgi:BirA family biotin operon repressor/biotin-[acetyl-CoA-carboxylase] ligase
VSLTGEQTPRFAYPISSFEEIDSTNAEARRRAEAGETGPLWITAQRQTAGRGRRGRAWETGPGNLAATLLITLDKSPGDASLSAFVTALAVSDLAIDWAPAALVKLKWPNDVMVDGRKVAGVLIESGKAPDGRLWLAIGVGVNLRTPPAQSERPATALYGHLNPGITEPPTPAQALERLSHHFQHWLRVWDGQGTTAVLAAWTARAQGMGGPCAAHLDRETVEGIAEGLDPDGALRLRLPDGSLRRITAGDVFFPHSR